MKRQSAKAVRKSVGIGMRGGGLEPPRVFSPLAPQTSASANSAILAQRGTIAPNKGPRPCRARAYCCPAGGASAGGVSTGASAAGGGDGSPPASGAVAGAGSAAELGKRRRRPELG